jgi:hypothetical protein
MPFITYHLPGEHGYDVLQEGTDNEYSQIGFSQR